MTFWNSRDNAGRSTHVKSTSFAAGFMGIDIAHGHVAKCGDTDHFAMLDD
jgi:hypothetical protein